MLAKEHTRYTFWGHLAAYWGVFGLILLIMQALLRLAPMAWALTSETLSWFQIVFLLVWVFFMAYSEGYKGFQKAFSPRVGARARWLREHPSLLRGILAPFFCMGLFGSTKKRKIVSWSLLIGITLIIIAVKQLNQPWRGLIDAGVVVGLSWGILSLFYFAALGLWTEREMADPEIGDAYL